MSAPIDLDGIKARRERIVTVHDGNTHDVLAALRDINPLVAEVERLQAERDDARLALAMAKGGGPAYNGWPEGWTKHPVHSEWTSPDGRARIDRVQHLGSLVWIVLVQERADDPKAWSHLRGSLFYYTDPLAALRAYQAMVKE